jgi:hypothetical protein
MGDGMNVKGALLAGTGVTASGFKGVDAEGLFAGVVGYSAIGSGVVGRTDRGDALLFGDEPA